MTTHRYDDIIDLPHHVSKTHPQMPRTARAAQFSPFAALSGYGDAVSEAARYTESRPELSEDERSELDWRLGMVQQRSPDAPEVTVAYFVEDMHKEGGAHKVVRGAVAKVDPDARCLVMRSGESIPIDDIVAIDDGREA